VSLLLKRSRIALNEAYDVVCEGRIVGRIMLTNVAAPYWSWTLAYRTPTRGYEATIATAMQAFAKAGTGNKVGGVRLSVYASSPRVCPPM
jgi:hypothetical protein